MLLSAIAFGVPVDMTKVHIEGITHLEAKDIKFAEELGYRIKLLGRARMRDGKLEAVVGREEASNFASIRRLFPHAACSPM